MSWPTALPSWTSKLYPAPIISPSTLADSPSKSTEPAIRIAPVIVPLTTIVCPAAITSPSTVPLMIMLWPNAIKSPFTVPSKTNSPAVTYRSSLMTSSLIMTIFSPERPSKALAGVAKIIENKVSRAKIDKSLRVRFMGFSLRNEKQPSIEKTYVSYTGKSHKGLLYFFLLWIPLQWLQGFLTFCDSLLKKCHSFGMPCFPCQIDWRFAVIAFHVQIRAAIKKSADHAFISVLCGHVERSITTLFADVWVGPVFQEHFYDFGMTRRGRRLNRRGIEIIT